MRPTSVPAWPGGPSGGRSRVVRRLTAEPGGGEARRSADAMPSASRCSELTDRFLPNGPSRTSRLAVHRQPVAVAAATRSSRSAFRSNGGSRDHTFAGFPAGNLLDLPDGIVPAGSFTDRDCCQSISPSSHASGTRAPQRPQPPPLTQAVGTRSRPWLETPPPASRASPARASRLHPCFVAEPHRSQPYGVPEGRSR